MKTYKLPVQVKQWRSSLESCATFSILKPTNALSSRRSDAQFTSYVFSKEGFCIDYFDYSKQGELIIKSDLFKILNYKDELYYKSVKKSDYPHHHIRSSCKMLDRVNSVIAIEDSNSSH